jgi:hypothetical protein
LHDNKFYDIECRMSALCPQPPKKIRRTLGPYPRLLTKGIAGTSIDGRSQDGRFLRQFEADLISHVGGKPSTTELLLIRRLARIALRLEKFDAKMETGVWNDIDGRTYGALQGAYLRTLTVLSLKPPPPRQLTPQEQLAALTAAARRGRVQLDDDD